MQIFHHTLQNVSHPWVWEESTEPFDELILSWNGFRPSEGFWTFSISLFQTTWSPWLKYAEWGAGRQKTFRANLPSIKTDQDIAAPTSGQCTKFRIRVTAEEGASLHNLSTLISALANSAKTQTHPLPFLPKTHLPCWIPRQSQKILPHPRAKDLCSPTSTSAAINYLLKQPRINPTLFAEQVRDQEFDIYGNWILNTAEAFHLLEGKFRTYVARLSSFADVHAQITKGLPVVASIKGPLAGAPMPYAAGHLLLITGYDPHLQRIFCMDPGHLSDAETDISYSTDAFLEAWGRRRHLAYLFEHIAGE